jgi:predicted DNA-binding protein with PD1-like motif
MQSRRLDEAGGLRTFAVAFEAGDDVMEGLRAFADRADLAAATFTGIGGFRDVTLGFFDLEKKDYERIPIREQVEVVALTGNVTMSGADHRVHAHVVVATRDGIAHGGHLLEAHVRPTLEVMVVESPPHLRRRRDPQTGLALLQLST